MPRVKRILETALYVDDLEGSVDFYERVIGLRAMTTGDRPGTPIANARLVAMDSGEGTVLLLFRRGATLAGVSFPNGRIPPHDGEGPAHFAFAIDSKDLDSWRRHLVAESVEIESELNWERGGTSIYFRDPDGHSVELATPGVWEVY